MNKTEVLVDTVFLNKLSAEGKSIETFKKIMEELNYFPVFHPYIACNELDMYSYFQKLVEEGYARVAQYDEFLLDDADRSLYQAYFLEIHNELCRYLDNSGKGKRLSKLELPPGQDIFKYRKASMSLGDVHMVLMAFFTKMPVILTEDSDIEILRSITKRKLRSNSYSLEIYNAVDVLMTIAQMETTSFSKSDLVSIVKSIGKRHVQSEIKKAWNDKHPSL